MGFFSETQGKIVYERYGLLHFEMIFTFLLIIFLMFIFKNKLKKFKYKDKTIRNIFATILFVNLTGSYIIAAFNGTWSFKTHLPLHICFIANYLFVYVLLTNNKRNWFNVVYFLTFIGPLPYILFPEMNVNGELTLVGFDRFLWWQAYISHYFLIISSLYCLFVLNWKVNKKGIIDTILVANIIFLLISIFNNIFGTNYIMTNSLPDFIIKMFPFVKIIDWPYLWLEITGLIALFVSYIPVIINNKYKNI